MNTRTHTVGRAALALIAVLAIAFHADAASYVTITKGESGQLHVKQGGKHFATLHTQGFAKPIIYPIIGPNGVRMTRDYPMKKDTPDERADHPHHQSLWYTHGDVNGVSFWHLGKDAGTIVTTKVGTQDAGARAYVTLHNKWVDAKGKTLLTDEQKITFHKQYAVGGGQSPDGPNPEYSMIDYEITLHASEGDVTFGDTKEGTMGIRTHPALRVNKGAAAVNSEGVKGKAVWGKAAAWVDYSAKVGQHHVGVAILDHPSNPRHPTTWHARDYGLVAANPFGLSYFEKKPRGTGNLKLEKGKKITFKYRFIFHEGDAKTVNVPARFKEWSGVKAAE